MLVEIVLVYLAEITFLNMGWFWEKQALLLCVYHTMYMCYYVFMFGLILLKKSGYLCSTWYNVWFVQGVCILTLTLKLMHSGAFIFLSSALLKSSLVPLLFILILPPLTGCVVSGYNTSYICLFLATKPLYLLVLAGDIWFHHASAVTQTFV